MATKRWWESFFDDTYADVGLQPLEPEKRDRLVGFLADVLDLSVGDTVLDQCCGVGRLSLPLAAAGYRVIGVDRVPAYIERARSAATERGLDLELCCDDAETFVAGRPCDGAFSWFTSFGYDDEDDTPTLRSFERALDSLRPGGRYAVDYLNVPMVCREFRSRQFHHVDEDDPQGLIILQEPSADFARGVLDNTWTFLHPDGRRESRQVTTRMYMPHEIVRMLRQAGFAHDVQLYGSIEGEPLGFESRRCIVVAEKPRGG